MMHLRPSLAASLALARLLSHPHCPFSRRQAAPQRSSQERIESSTPMPRLHHWPHRPALCWGCWCIEEHAVADQGRR